MLDHSIRDPLAPSISLRFYSWTGRGGSSSSINSASLCLTAGFEVDTHLFSCKQSYGHTIFVKMFRHHSPHSF
jgi:hypothetical protein